MQYHQPFCGNGQTYGYNSYNAPPYPNVSSHIVGEGDVTSVALPDGSFQFFFIPKVKWWPHAANTCPYYTNVMNANNPYCGQFETNLGAWFVRTITNPAPAAFSSPTCHEYPRYEVPTPFYSDCNFNVNNNGYRLKFHNDHSTSTSDIHYFFPCLRQLDCTLALPGRGCAAVQVTTPTANNTMCHYEFTCSKPCHCMPKHSCDPATSKTASAMSLEDTMSSLKDVICDCYYDTSGKTKKSKNKSGCNGKKISKSSLKAICDCDVPLKQKPNRSNIKIGSNDKTRRMYSKTTLKAGDCDCIIPSFGKSSNTNTMFSSDGKSTLNESFNKCDSLVKDKRKCVCGSIGRRSRPISNNKTTSNETICECLDKSRKTHDSESRSDEVISKCDQFLSQRKKPRQTTKEVNNTKRKDKCVCCSRCCSQYCKNKSSEVNYECAQPLTKLKSDCTSYPKANTRGGICEWAQSSTKLKCDSTCQSKKVPKPEEKEIVCECAQSLTERKSDCMSYSKANKRGGICEWAQSSTKLKCDSTCQSKKVPKPEEKEIVCECAQSLTERKSDCMSYSKANKRGGICEWAHSSTKLKCDSTCQSKKVPKPEEKEIVCECAQSLTERKSDCTSYSKANTRGGICEWAQSSNKLKCDSTCQSKKVPKPKEKNNICERAQSVIERKSDYMLYSKKTKRKYDPCPCEVICECAQSLAKLEKSDCGSLYDAKDTTKVTCECAEYLSKEREVKAECECCDCNKKSTCCLRCAGDVKQMQLLPTDGRRKRIKLDKRPQRPNERQSKDVICESVPPPCSNKSLATCSDKSSGGEHSIQVDCSTQCFCEEDAARTNPENIVYRCRVEPEIWRPVTALSRKRFRSPRHNNYSASSCSSSTCTSDVDK